MKTYLNLCIKRSTSSINSFMSTLYGRSVLFQTSSMGALDSLHSLTCSLGRKVYKQHCGENAKKILQCCVFFFNSQLNVLLRTSHSLPLYFKSYSSAGGF